MKKFVWLIPVLLFFSSPVYCAVTPLSITKISRPLNVTILHTDKVPPTSLMLAQNQNKSGKKSKPKSYYPGYAKQKKQKKTSKIWKSQTNRPGGNTRAKGNTRWKDYKLLYQYTRNLGQPAWVHPANRK